MEENEIACDSDEDTVEYEIEVVTSASSVSLASPVQSLDDQKLESTHQRNDELEIQSIRADQTTGSQALNQKLSGSDRDLCNTNNETDDEAKNCELDAEPLVTNGMLENSDQNLLDSESPIAPKEPTDNYAAQIVNQDLDNKLDNCPNNSLSELQAFNAQVQCETNRGVNCGEPSNNDNSTELSISGSHEAAIIVEDHIPESSDSATDSANIASANLPPELKDGQALAPFDQSTRQQEVPRFYDLKENEKEQEHGQQRVDLDVRRELAPATVDPIVSEKDTDEAIEHPRESHTECELMTASACAAPLKTLTESNQSTSNESPQTHHQKLSTEQACLVTAAATATATRATAAAKASPSDASQATAEPIEVTTPNETITGGSDNGVAPVTDAIIASGDDHLPEMNLIERQLVSGQEDKLAEWPDEVAGQMQIDPVPHESTSMSSSDLIETDLESGSTKVVDELDPGMLQLTGNESVQPLDCGESESTSSKEPGPVSEIEKTDCVGSPGARPIDTSSQELPTKVDDGEHPELKTDDSRLVVDTHRSSIDISVELVPTAPQVILSLSESATGDHADNENHSTPSLDKGYTNNCDHWDDDNERGGDEADEDNYSPLSPESSCRQMHNLRLYDDNLFAVDYDDLDDLEREFDEEPEFESRNVAVKRNRDPRDEYELGTELGRGRFGTVFKCTELATGRQLAAKFISMRNQEDRENVEREVAIMSLLQHKRLLQLYDAFDEGPQEMCLITELVEGGELFERIVDDDFDLTEKKAAIFMRQICEGVEYMHSKQVVHLDMKPENILCLSRTGHRIKLIDFGLARRLDPQKPIQVMFGTPDFAAPEVLGYETVTLATDMWSVGVICYVLLSGLSPFMGENDLDTMANVTRATYDFNDQAFEPISELAKDFIAKLLLRQPEKRLKPSECLKHAWLQRGGVQLEVAVRERRESTSVLHRLAMEQAVAAAALATNSSMAEMSPPVFGQQHRASFGAESTTSSGLFSLDKRRLKRYVVRRKWHRMVHAIMALNRMGANLVFEQ